MFSLSGGVVEFGSGAANVLATSTEKRMKSERQYEVDRVAMAADKLLLTIARSNT